MNWICFEDKHKKRFLTFVSQNCRNLFALLNDYEKSMFYRYWLKIFNDCENYLLTDGHSDYGFAAKSQWKPKHWLTWAENILLTEMDLAELPILPEGFSDQEFCTVHSEKLDQSVISQFCMVAELENFDKFKAGAINQDFAYQTTTRNRAEEVAELFAPEHRASDLKPGFYEKYYLPDLCEKLRNNHEDYYGFSYCAIDKTTDKAAAAVFYEAYELPLTGTPCVIIYDILVKKEFRRKHIAVSLQAHAYDDMKKKGVRWVCGNIDPGNSSSLKQAYALGRKNLTCRIKISY